MARQATEPRTASPVGPVRPGGTPLGRSLAIWFGVIAAVACVSIGTLTYYTRARDMREQMFHSLEVLRDAHVSSIRLWLKERRLDLELWSSRPGVVQICERALAGAKVDTPDDRSYLEDVRAAYGFNAVMIIEPKQGRILAATHQRPGASHSVGDAEIRKIVEHKRTVFSDVSICPVDDRPEIVVASPVFAPRTRTVIGIIAFRLGMHEEFYPRLLQDGRLGQTGEMLLVNRDRIAQSPLKFQEGAVGFHKIDAEPARRAAAGTTGRIPTEDYRSVPVMAAYGHIPETGWGLVVKQDMAEISAPVRKMGRDVAIVSLVVLMLSVGIGLIVARMIARPAVAIAAVAERIGLGDTELRAEEAGPSEVRMIARSLNAMLDTLTRHARIRSAASDIYAKASTQHTTIGLLNEVLPMLMEATRSQSGVAYLAGEDGGSLECALAHGISPDQIKREINIAPPDSLMAQVALLGKCQVTNDIQTEGGLLIVTQAGPIPLRSLLNIPLMWRKRVVGLIALASLHDYREEDTEMVEAISTDLAQALTACEAHERTEHLARELQNTNEELASTNEELASTNEELQSQAEELQRQAGELETQQARIKEADRLKSEFLSNMSHELRTPLNSILALSQLMISRGVGRDAEQDRQYIQIMDRNGRRLLGLINDILDLSKIESGRMDIVPSQFETPRLVEQVVETVRPMAQEKGLSLHWTADGVPLMFTDQDKLRQILLNLLSNAVKFTEQGEVKLVVAASHEQVTFSVKDTGIGIARADIEHIFDKFRQVDGSATRRYDGTGLGLAICQRLAKMLGGKLDADSRVGEGSTFTLVLPLRCPAEAQPPADAVETQTMPPAASARAQRPVLLVDDDPTIHKPIKQLLDRAGYDVTVAESGREALDLARKLRPIAISLDLSMPDMDGWQVLRELQAHDATADIPVIIMSGADERDAATALGAAGCLVKPASAHELIAEIERVTSRTMGRQVLIVDDSEVEALQVQSVLTEQGYETTLAGSGAEALTHLQSRRYDAVILDLMMPDMDGFAVLDRIRLAPWSAKTPVLVLTAKELTADELAHLKSSRIQQFIQKGSVDREELAAAVGRLLTGPNARPKESVSAFGQADLAGKTVLIVEDNPDNRVAIEATMGELGCTLLTAEDGEQAVRLAKQHRPDLILMDIQLPVLSGLDATKQIKADPELAGTPIIALTAKAMKGDREQILDAGCDEYIAKPIDLDLLVHTVRKWLG